MRSSSVAWFAKLIAKAAMINSPVPYATWRRLGLFRHGAMDEPDRARAIFDKHAKRGTLPGAFTTLELGPGDSVATGLVAYAHGGRRTYLVDADRFATEDLGFYRTLAASLARDGCEVPDLSDARNLDELLAQCNARYLTSGVASLREIPSGSVDFVFSSTVLQHIPKDQFETVLRQMRRIMRPGAWASHTVDLSDTTGGLHHLLWDSRLWESRLVAASGYYTNRIRFAAMLDAFRRAGFTVEPLSTDRWRVPPVRRHELAHQFREMSDEDLAVRGFECILTIAQETAGQAR